MRFEIYPVFSGYNPKIPENKFTFIQKGDRFPQESNHGEILLAFTLRQGKKVFCERSIL